MGKIADRLRWFYEQLESIDSTTEFEFEGPTYDKGTDRWWVRKKANELTWIRSFSTCELAQAWIDREHQCESRKEK